jgi:tRNA(Arg) A34 adenosine deaminase TadA
MSDKKLMLLAIKEAKKSKQPIGCGVVIAKDGKIIAKAHNEQRETNDVSAHAEIKAIRKAGRNLKTKNLEGCVIYCTCEPCTMCLSAIIFAKISKLFYGTSMQETFPDNLPITLSTNELLSYTEHKIKIMPGFMRDRCLVLLRKD